MKDNKQQEEGLSSKALAKIKEFSLTSVSVDNRTSVLILMGIIFFAGLMAYRAMPKEQYPEINQPTVYVGIPYPGNAPLDIENQKQSNPHGFWHCTWPPAVKNPKKVQKHEHMPFLGGS